MIEQNDKQIERLGAKGNTFVVGVFEKYKAKVGKNQNAVVLDRPSDMGNLGTIMREMLGFGYKNLIVTKPCADFFNPKVVRASMGAIFGLDIETFESFDDFERTSTQNTGYALTTEVLGFDDRRVFIFITVIDNKDSITGRYVITDKDDNVLDVITFKQDNDEWSEDA